MENYRKLRKSLIKEILFTIFFVIVTIPLWLNFNLAAKSVDIPDDFCYIEYQVYNNYPSKSVAVFNNHLVSDDYEVVTKLDKGIVNKDTYINVNGERKKLLDYNKYNDDNYDYFIIDSSSLKADVAVYTIDISGVDYDLLVNA